MSEQYLKARCDGCGGRIKKTSPQSHVRSSFTGLRYCRQCCRNGLPPVHKRPLATQALTVRFSAGAVEGRRTIVSEQETTEQETSDTSAILNALLERVKKEIPGAELTPSPNGNYTTVKANGKTIGYINGKKKVRIDGPRREGERKQMLVTEESQLDSAVQFVAGYVQAAKAENGTKAKSKATSAKAAKPDPKPSKKQRAAAKS